VEFLFAAFLGHCLLEVTALSVAIVSPSLLRIDSYVSLYALSSKEQANHQQAGRSSIMLWYFHFRFAFLVSGVLDSHTSKRTDD